MRPWTRRALLVACASGVTVQGSPAPTITPAPLLPRLKVETLAWYSTATVGDDTIYAPWTFDADQTTYTSSSIWFRRCAVGSTCALYTSCSAGYMMAASTSTFCGAGGGAGSLFCSNHILYPSTGASLASSWYWCDTAPLTGVTFFAQEPSQPSSSSSRPASTSARTTSSSSGSRSSSVASTPPTGPTTTPTAPTDEGSSTNVGAIAGGVVGGVAVLALIVAGVWFFFFRDKNKGAYAPPPNRQSFHPGYPASPEMGYATAYQANEAKPQGVQEMGGYYPQQQQQPAPYPQGPYDPHMSQYGGVPPQASPPAQFPAPQPAPQEMPTEK